MPLTAEPSDDSPRRVARGTVLPVWATLGSATWAARQPADEAGNGFETRWPDDLELLAHHGITDVRLTLDWARVTPRESSVNGDAVEWYRNVLEHGRSLGLSMWITLLERDVPRWFDDAGGFTDSASAGRWWPRWVETAADVVGDLAAGWHPLDDPLAWADRLARRNGHVDLVRQGEILDTLVVAWRDAWRILRGGPAVATSLHVGPVSPVDQSLEAAQDARRRDHLMWTLWLRGLRDGSIVIPGRADRELADLAGAADAIGVGMALSPRDLPDARVTDHALELLSDRIGHHLRRAAETGPDRPLHVTSLRLPAQELADRGHLMRAAVSAIDDATRDGVRIDAAFVEPAIDVAPLERRVAQGGLFTRDRVVTPALEAWLS